MSEVNGNKEPSKLLDKAYGISFNPTRNKFQLIEISYNAEGQTGEYKVLEESESSSSVQNSFRITVANNIFKTFGVR